MPIVAGAEGPLLGAFRSETQVHGTDGLAGVALPEGPPATPGIAADAIRALLRAERGVTLIGIGPATNLALALATEPALINRVDEIVLMTGAWSEGNITPSAEFNAWSDPEALAMLLECGRPVTLATLELTAQALVTPARIAALRAAGGGACLDAATRIMASVPTSRRFAHQGHPLHDPCAIAWLLDPRCSPAATCMCMSNARRRSRPHRRGPLGAAACDSECATARHARCRQLLRDADGSPRRLAVRACLESAASDRSPTPPPTQYPPGVRRGARLRKSP